MTKKGFSSIIKALVCVLLVMFLCVGVSCKKTSPQPPAEESQETTGVPIVEANDVNVETPNAPMLTTVEEPNVPAEDVNAPIDINVPPDANISADANVPIDPNAPKLVPIEIELPKPMFVGTPLDSRVPNLEKPRVGPRPPFLAPVGTKNVALGKLVSSSDEEPIIGEVEMVTDGDKEASDGSYVELGPFVQHVTIDLGAIHEIYAIVVWHYHKQALVYFDVIVQVADDADFITNVRTLFNNDTDNSTGLGAGKDMNYTETNEGKLIDAKGVRARYIRLYSNGNNGNDLNHYIEVAVYGKTVE